MKNTLVISMVLAGMLFVVAPVIGLNDVQAKPSSLQANKICKPVAVVGIGKAANKHKAKKRAIRNWRQKVPHPWNKWRIAANKKIMIKQIQNNSKWKAWVKARPCRKLGYRTP